MGLRLGGGRHSPEAFVLLIQLKRQGAIVLAGLVIGLHICDLSILEAEAGGSPFGGHPGLHRLSSNKETFVVPVLGLN